MYSFPSSRLYPDILNPNLNVYRYPRCVSVLPETYVFLWLLGNLPSFFFFWNAAISVTGISNSCTKKFLPSDNIRKSAISKEGWPDGKESDCFPGQSGGRGETPEESKWGWTAQKAKSWGQCQAQVMVQSLIKPYFSSLLFCTPKKDSQDNKEDISQIRDILFFTFLHHRANKQFTLQPL